MTFDPEEVLFQAKLAEQAERYEEMASLMKDFATHNTKEFSTEERNLLSVAYKNAVGNRRSSLRLLSVKKDRLNPKESAENYKLVCDYISKIASEFEQTCLEVIDILKKLVESESTDEGKVFYYKMQGDYLRYLAEFTDDKEQLKYATEAGEAYGNASEAAEALETTNPIRLGLALNFSVYYYEIKKDHEKACTIAKTAFDESMAVLDSLSEDNYKDSTLIMQLLRDNLTLWSEGRNDEVKELNEEKEP